MEITIIDTGLGNVSSVSNAVHHLGHISRITADPCLLSSSSAIILPGVGTFDKAMETLSASSLDEALIDAAHKGIKILGICLGFQLLFSSSEEGLGLKTGLGLMEGKVNMLAGTNIRIPHVGFDVTDIEISGGFLSGLGHKADFYYVHSYCVDKGTLTMDALATCSYGKEFVAAFQKDNIYGCQFHPEKSQKNGLQILANFIND